MELQEKYKARYKGRKGRKKLQAILDETARLRAETGNYYAEYEEMQLIDSLLPDPAVKLYFTKYYRDLDRMWSGVETYGFLRLCGKWIRQNQIEELTQPDIDAMLESLLPSWEWTMLTEPPAEEPAAVNAGRPAGKQK